MMPDTDRIVDVTLTRLGWAWGDAHVLVTLNTPWGPVVVRIPFAEVWAAFRQHLPGAGVGCPHTVGGLWGSIKKAARNISRKAKKTYKRVVPKKLQRAANQVLQKARNVLAAVKSAYTSDAAMYALMGLAVVPGMAPASAGLLAARAALKRIDAAQKVAQRIIGGAKATKGMIETLRRGKDAKENTVKALHAARSGQTHAKNFLQGLSAIGIGG